MSIPVQGRVTLKDNQALVVLNVATNNNQAEERPRSDLEALLNRALRQEVPVHPTRLPLLRKHLAAMVCNVQKGVPLGPRGLARCLECSCRTKAAGVLDKAKEGGDSEASRPSHCSTCTSASLNFHLKCRVCSSYTSCSAPPAHMHALTKVLQLEDGKVSDSSSTSDSSYSDSSSSTSSEEEAMPEYVPNPSLPPPPEYPSDDEYGMPNPSLGPQSDRSPHG